MMQIFLALALFLLMPLSAVAEALEGKVSKSAVKEEAQQSSLQGEGASTSGQQSEFDLQRQPLSGQAEHGELPIGVLGCQILTTLFGGHSALIIKIYPGSDLIRAGVRTGDKILGINGHRFARKSFPSECRGSPGTMINLLIERHGQEVEVQVQRQDARMFAAYEHYFRKWADRTKYW
ncbi:MAG: hypothetical protein C5B53_02170 [Candidatus Melainabacteria bacterium]|nr:MAG: hypothetical protein C5B53_02170 [Candidatus Melainabacteria bacterium]